MDGEHKGVGLGEIVEGHKLSAGGLDPGSAFGREHAFIRKVGFGDEFAIPVMPMVCSRHRLADITHATTPGLADHET